MKLKITPIILQQTATHFSDMNKVSVLSIFIGLFVSCTGNKETNYERIDSFLQSAYDGKSLNNYDYMIVINEEGDCLNCNKSFTKRIANYTEYENTLFLICTPGSNVDISSYIAEEKDNILLDYHNKFSDLNLTDHCAIFELKNHQIDTIIQIDAFNLETTLSTFMQ